MLTTGLHFLPFGECSLNRSPGSQQKTPLIRLFVDAFCFFSGSRSSPSIHPSILHLKLCEDRKNLGQSIHSIVAFFACPFFNYFFCVPYRLVCSSQLPERSHEWLELWCIHPHLTQWATTELKWNAEFGPSSSETVSSTRVMKNMATTQNNARSEAKLWIPKREDAR